MLLVLVLFVVRTPVASSSQISLPAQTAAPGSSVVMPLAFDSQAGFITGIQFDVEYDNSAMSVDATAGDALRNSGKSLYVADLAPGKKRFLIAGLNQNPIPDGTLVNVFINLRPDAGSRLFDLRFSNVVASDLSGQAAPAAASDGTLTVEGTAAGSVPLQSPGILNAASLTPGAVAPGEIVTLIGSGIGPSQPETPDNPGDTALGGITVLFDGTAAPLLYAGPNQINAIVPFAVAGNAVTDLRIVSLGRSLATINVDVAAAAPAIFAQDSTGIGQGAILNEDSIPNSPSSPAGKGSVVVLFATGGGQTDPAGVDAQLAGDPLPQPKLPVSVQIGGQDAEVLYAGAAPGMVAGVLQINCRVPQSVASGPSVPVLLRIGETTSPAGVTLAVK